MVDLRKTGGGVAFAIDTILILIKKNNINNKPLFFITKSLFIFHHEIPIMYVNE
jgi:hypothetical protein